MDTVQLKILLEIAERGSLVSAARSLNMDPSSVSRALAAVEAKLGIRVFQRNTRHVSLTTVGSDYLQRIRPLIAELEQATEELREEQSSPTGLVRITSSVAFGQEALLPVLPGLRSVLPDVELDFQLTARQIDLVAENVDLAIRMAPAPKGDLMSVRLMTTRYRLCAAPAYLADTGVLQHPNDLAERDCLRLSLEGFRRAFHFRLKSEEPQITVPVKGAVTFSEPLALRAAARMGLGPALLADWMIAQDLRDGRLVDVFPDWDVAATQFETGVYALYPSRTFMPRRTRAVLDFLKACY